MEGGAPCLDIGGSFAVICVPRNILVVYSSASMSTGTRNEFTMTALDHNRRCRRPLLLVVFSFLWGITACASSPVPQLRSMSLDEKVGQLVVVAAQGTFMNEESPSYVRLLRYVRERHVGGVIWYGADVYETAWANDRLQSAAKIPLLVSADLESGVGMRFEHATFWPWPMAIAATGDPSIAEAEGRLVAREARLLGINQIYAPVADVNNNPDNPVINVRSFGEDPEAVAQFVSAFVRGVQSENVIATVKHFPGHGDTRTDSHRSLPSLDVSRDRLDSVELPPFRAAIHAGVGSVMLAHISIPSVDPTPLPAGRRAEDNPYAASESEINLQPTLPASLSPGIVDGLLRKELGFDGLVVTDALDMGGITDHFDAGEAAVRAILAGADQVLKSSDADRALDALKKAVESGRISVKRLDESIERILRAKRGIRPLPFDIERIFRGVDTPEHRAVAEEAARRALTLVREEPGSLPLSPDAPIAIAEIGYSPETYSPLTDFRRELHSRLDRAPEQFSIDRRSTDTDVLEIMEATKDAVVIVAFTVRTRSGAGTVTVPEVGRRLVESLLERGTRVIAISFGNPYLLREVPSLQTYVAAWGVQPVMQRAAATALFGETPFSGHLPVSIPGIAERGDGISRNAE